MFGKFEILSANKSKTFKINLLEKKLDKNKRERENLDKVDEGDIERRDSVKERFVRDHARGKISKIVVIMWVSSCFCGLEKPKISGFCKLQLFIFCFSHKHLFK